MLTRFTSAQIEQFRRDAKRLARSKSIPLSQAQGQLASENGFRNWSLLVKHASSGPTTTSFTPAATTDARTRYYVHGDQDEEDSTRFYCAQCDEFFPRDHFTQHGAETFERALQSIARWSGRPAETRLKFRRQDDAQNILLRAALAEHASFEASRSPFHRWLEGQRKRDDIVGDVAGDVLSDRSFPRGSLELEVLKDHLERKGAVPGALEALEAAWAEFSVQPTQFRPGG